MYITRSTPASVVNTGMDARRSEGDPGLSKLGNFVWGIADQLRGVYKPHQYGGVILPFTILRRLDCTHFNYCNPVSRLVDTVRGGRLAGCHGANRFIAFLKPLLGHTAGKTFVTACKARSPLMPRRRAP